MDEDSEIVPATQMMDATQILESSADSEPASENAQIGILKVDGQNHPVYTGDNVIGRAPSCQVVLEYSAVSSKHAVIEASTKICTIHDMESSNGTKKGGNTLRPHIRFELKDGDELKFGDILASWTTQVDLDLSESLFEESDYGTPVGPSTVRAPFRTPAPPDRFGTPRDFVPETPCGAGPLKAAFNTSELNFVPASQSSPLPRRDVIEVPESPGDCLDDSSFICASQQPAAVRPIRPQTASQFTITKIEEHQAAVVSSVPDSDEEDVDLTLAPDTPRDNVDGILEVETQVVTEMPHSDVFNAETQPVSANDMFAAETQAVSNNVFDVNTQAVYSASETDDLLAAATQAVPHEEGGADDMFGMCTQAVVEPERERERGVSESDLMEAETQAVVHNDNIMSDSELFGAATQAPTNAANDLELMGAPLQVPVRSFRESMSDSQLMGAPTQANRVSFSDTSNDSEMFRNSENSEIQKAVDSSSMSDSLLMGAPTQSIQPRTKMNDSEMFGASTQAVSASSMSDSLLMGAPTQTIVSNKMNDSEMFGAATQAVAPGSMTDSLLFGASTQAISNPPTDDDLMGASTQMVADVTTDSVFESIKKNEHIFTEATQAVGPATKHMDEEDDLFMGATQAVVSDKSDADFLTEETQAVNQNVEADDLDTSKDSEILDSNTDMEPVKENGEVLNELNEGPLAVSTAKLDPDILSGDTQVVDVKHQHENPEAFEPNDADTSNDSLIPDSNTALEPEKEKNPSVNDEQNHSLIKAMEVVENHDLEPEKEKFESNDLDISNDSIVLDSNTDLEPEKVNGDVTREEPEKEVIFQSETDKNESVHEEQIADTQAMEYIESEDDDDDFIGATQAPVEIFKEVSTAGTPAVETYQTDVNAEVQDINKDLEVEGDTQVPDNVNSHDLKATDNLSDISEDSVEPDKKDDNISDISDDLLMENGDVESVEDVPDVNSEVGTTNHDFKGEVAQEPSAPVTTEGDDDLDDTTDIKNPIKDGLDTGEDEAAVDGDDSVVLSSQMSDPSRLSKTNYESVTMMKDDSVIASSQPPEALKKLSNTTYGTINMDQTEVVESPIISAKEGEKQMDTKDAIATEERQDFAKVLAEPELVMGSPIFISKKNKSMSQSMMSQSRLEESARKSILEEADDQEELEESFASNVSVTRRSKPSNGFKIDTSVTLADDNEIEKESESVTPEEVSDPVDPEEPEKDPSDEPQSEPDSIPLLPMTQALIGGDDGEVENSDSEEEEDMEPNALIIVEKDVVQKESPPVPVIKKTPKTPAAKSKISPKLSPAKSKISPKPSSAKSKISPRPSPVKSKISPAPSPVNSQNSSFSEDSQDDMGRGRRQRKPTAVMELSMEQEKEEEEEKAAKSPMKKRISKVTSLIKAVEKEVQDDEAATQPWLGTDVPVDSEEVLEDTQPLVIEELKSKRVRKSTAKILEMEASQTPVAQPPKTKTPVVVKETKTIKIKTPVTVKEPKIKTPVVAKETKRKTPTASKTPVAVISSEADTQPWVGTEQNEEADEDSSKSKRVRKATPKMLEMEAAKTQVVSKTPAASNKAAIAPKRLVLASRTSTGATKPPVVAVRTPVIVSHSSIASKTLSPQNNSTFASPVLNKGAIAKIPQTTPAVEPTTVAGRKSVLENKPREKAANKRRSSLIVTEKEGESPTKRVKGETTPKEVEIPAQRRGASKKLPLPSSLLIEDQEPVASKAKGRGRKSELKPAEMEETIPATPAQRRGKGKKLAMPNSLLINTPEASLAVESAIPSPVSLPTPVVEPEPTRGRRGRPSKAAKAPQAAPAPKGRRGRQSTPVETPEPSIEEEEEPAPAPKGRRGRVETPEPSIEEVEEPAPAPKGRRGRPSVVPEANVAEPVKRGRKAAVVETVEPEKDKLEAEPVAKGRRGKKQIEPEEESQPDPEPSSRGRKGRPSKASAEPEPEKEPEPVKARKGRGRGSQPAEEIKQTNVKGGKNQKTETQPDTAADAAADTSANEFIVEEPSKKGRSRGGKRKQEEEVPTAAKKTKTESKPASRKGASEIESPVPSPAMRRVSQDSDTLNARSLSPSIRRGSSASRGASTRHQVMFTGYNDKKDNDLVVELGGVLTDVCSECSVLVTDQIKRTEKLLCAVAKGVPVVSPSWLQESKKSGSFLDPWQFVINDTDREKQWEFSLVKTLQSAKKQPLLKGLKIHVTSKVKPPPELFQQVIQAGGGEYLNSLPKKSEKGLLVISCPENKSSHAKLNKAGIPIMDKEFILTGLLQFKLDYELVL